jgi:transcriptional regulator with XRE-family HTH domain
MLTETASSLYPVETMGSRITILREARGLSVPELAEIIGVTRALVWQWEQDMVKGIRPENFIRLCHALNVTPEYLVWGPDRPPSAATPSKSRRP